MSCINKSHPEFKTLLKNSKENPASLAADIGVWMDNNTSERFPTLEELGITSSRITAHLKIIDVLPTLQRNVFSKDKIQGWLNDLQKKGVSAAQLEMFREVAEPGMTKDDITIAIAAKNSFAVEVNRQAGYYAGEKPRTVDSVYEILGNITDKNDILYLGDAENPSDLSIYGMNEYKVKLDDFIEASLSTGRTSEQVVQDIRDNFFKIDHEWLHYSRVSPELEYDGDAFNTVGHYSNLTVPGGTNYTENEIATPDITPNIKGHAEFSTDNGIGWFRSDEEVTSKNLNYSVIRGIDGFSVANFNTEKEAQDYINNSNEELFITKDERFGSNIVSALKTRRILEFQSDLFQKGRDNKSLIKDDKIQEKRDRAIANGAVGYMDLVGGEVSDSRNQFLQLLNKKNNWVNFFIKSIIQDSTKKGYEKVLFPSGETAAKVEGHQTIADEIKRIDEQIKEVEKSLKTTYFVVRNKIDESGLSFKTRKEAEKKLQEQLDFKKSYINEEKGHKVDKLNLERLQKEKENLKSQGLEKLKPIEAFYKNRVTNVLKKQGYNPVKVTDEHGNTWNEVALEKERDEAPILYQKDLGKNAQKKAEKIYFDEVHKKDLSENDIGRINEKLKEISREIGDVDWNLRMSSKGSYYIAGYNNSPVTMDDYYSPHASQVFRQLSSKETIDRENKLEVKLGQWAKKNGISIRALKSVVKEFPNRYENSALGISDFANSLIALADNRKADTFAEEIAHFAIEMMLDKQKGVVNFLGPLEIETLLEKVVETQTYRDVKVEYKGIYKEEIDFRKEALGKILASEIVNEFRTSEELKNVEADKEANSFWGLIFAFGEAFNNFLDWVFGLGTRSRGEFENELIPLARSILAKETITDFQKFQGYTKADIKYQLDKALEGAPEIPDNLKVSDKKIKTKEDFLDRARKKLLTRLSEFDTGRLNSEEQINKFNKVISDLERNIAKQEWEVGVAQFINSAAEELTILDEILQDVLNPDSDRGLGSNSIRDARGFLDMYENLFADFRTQAIEAGFSADEVSEFNKMVNPITILIFNSQKRMNVLEKLDSVNSLTAANLDHNGEIIDPNFNPKEIGERATTDTSKYRLWVGNLKNAASGIVRSVHSMIFDSVAKIHRFATITARDVLNSQKYFLTKYSQEDLIEKDSDGNLTQNIIQKYRMRDYFNAVNKVKENLAKRFNIKNEEGEYDYNKIIPELLAPEQKEIYSKTWENFYKENTISQEENVVKYTTDTNGNLVIKTKMIKFGEITYATEGKIKDFESKGYSIVTTKKTVPNNKFLNKDFASRIKDPMFKNHYDLLIKKQRESIAKLAFKYQRESLVYQLPSVLKSNLDRLMATDLSFLERIKLLAQDAILIEEDDTEFGELNEFRKNTVPIFFTKRVDDISKLSFDVGRSIIMMSEMSENFREMNSIAGKISNIESTIGAREYEEGSGKNRTLRPEKGIGTTDYETIKFLKETFVLGKQMNDWSKEVEISEDNVFAKVIKKITFGKIDISGKNTLSFTKAITKFAQYVRNSNLGGNVPTALTGHLTATGDALIQDQIGLYTTHQSKNFSRKIFASEIPTVLAEIGSIKQTSKMHLIMQDNNILQLPDMIRDSGRGLLLRKATPSNAMYLFYATGDYAIKSRIAIAIYDNYRLYNGQFITRANFYIKTAEERGVENNKEHQKEVTAEWDNLQEKSLWNAYTAIDGQLEIKEEFKKFVTPEVLNSAQGKIEHVTHNVDGTMSKTDKGYLAKTALGAFPLMHRGFVFNLIDRKFKKGNSNFITQEEEIGEYRATKEFLAAGINNVYREGKLPFTGTAAAWNKLSPARKRGIYKTMLDLIYMNIVAMLAGLLLSLADDDEDEENWPLQFAALIGERWLLEVSAGWSPNEFVQIVKEPVVGARIIEEITSIGQILFDDEPLSKGMYEGWTKRQKWGFRRLPFGIKNVYELQYPEEKVKFIKQIVGENLYYASDEQDFSLSRWFMDRLGSWDNTYRMWEGDEDNDTKKRLTEDAIDELAEEEEYYNGFN